MVVPPRDARAGTVRTAAGWGGGVAGAEASPEVSVRHSIFNSVPLNLIQVNWYHARYGVSERPVVPPQQPPLGWREAPINPDGTISTAAEEVREFFIPLILSHHGLAWN